MKRESGGKILSGKFGVGEWKTERSRTEEACLRPVEGAEDDGAKGKENAVVMAVRWAPGSDGEYYASLGSESPEKSPGPGPRRPLPARPF